MTSGEPSPRDGDEERPQVALDLPLLSIAQLVGRERELEALVTAARRPPSVTLIEGEAGVGKTRLVTELLERPPAGVPHRHLVGHCQPLREPFPLGPIVDAMRNIVGMLPAKLELSLAAGALRPWLPELSHLLPPMPEPLPDAAAQRHRTFRGLVELVDAISPVLLAIDDFHWADDDTIEFLEFLFAHMPMASVVLAYRGEDIRDRSLGAITARIPRNLECVRIELAPLERNDVSKLVAAILETRAVSEEFTSYLYKITSGLPFAIEEVLLLLRERQDIMQEDGQWVRRELDRVAVPPAVRDSILERVRHLTSDTRQTIEAAAIIGTPTSDAVLQDVSGLRPERFERALSDALNHAVLWEDVGTYTFRHVLARQAVYEAVAAPRRGKLHLRAGNALERLGDESQVPALVHHFREGRNIRKHVRYCERAADLAIASHDYRTAYRFLRDSLSWPHLPRTTRVRLGTKLGTAAIHSMEHREAIQIVRGILSEAKLPPGARSELRYMVAMLSAQMGDTASERAEAAAAIPGLSRRPELAIRAMTLLAWPCVGGHRREELLAWLARAEKILSRVEDRKTRLAFIVDRAGILVELGSPEASDALRKIPRRGRSLAEQRELARGFMNIAVSCKDLGLYAQAESFLDSTATLCTSLAYDRFSSALESTRATIRWATGRWDGVEDRARSLIAESADIVHVLADCELLLASVLVVRGDLDEAQRLFQGATGKSGQLHPFIQATAGVARCRLLQGDREGAADVLEPALQVLRDTDIWVMGSDPVTVLVEALIACDAVDEAKRVVGEFADGVSALKAPLANSALLFCRGRLAEAQRNFQSAQRLFERAHSAWAALPRPYDSALAQEARGRCLLEVGDPTGTESIRQAIGVFSEAGAERDRRRAVRILRENGFKVPAPPANGRRGYGNRLSPRELDVAQLVAEGKTTREIAALLYLSPRTVEGHTSRAIRKLGVKSRTGLAVAVTGNALGESSNGG